MYRSNGWDSIRSTSTVNLTMHIQPHHHSTPFQQPPQQQRPQRQRGAVRAAAGDGETQWKRVSVLVRFLGVYVQVFVDLGGIFCFLNRIDEFATTVGVSLTAPPTKHHPPTTQSGPSYLSGTHTRRPNNAPTDSTPLTPYPLISITPTDPTHVYYYHRRLNPRRRVLCTWPSTGGTCWPPTPPRGSTSRYRLIDVDVYV